MCWALILPGSGKNTPPPPPHTHIHKTGGRLISTSLGFHEGLYVAFVRVLQHKVAGQHAHMSGTAPAHDAYTVHCIIHCSFFPRHQAYTG